MAAEDDDDSRQQEQKEQEQNEQVSGSAEDLEEAPHGSGPEVLSKRAAKRLAKQAKQQELKQVRRSHEKEQKKHKKEQRRSEVEALLSRLTEAEREELKKKQMDTRKVRQEEAAQHKLRLEKSLLEGPHLVIDMDFGGMMSDSELKHLGQQLSYSYSVNRKVQQPCHLHLTGYKGDIKAMLEKQITGLSKWKITRTEAGFVEHFAGQQSRLVYLTADSTTELEDVDSDSIYIIGGLIDHNRYKDFCLRRAEELGVATARLPIKKHVQLDSRAVLTINHVVQIMVEMMNRHDWRAVLEEVLPARKKAGFREAKAEAKARKLVEASEIDEAEVEADGMEEPSGSEHSLAESGPGGTAGEVKEMVQEHEAEDGQEQGNRKRKAGSPLQGGLDGGTSSPG